MKSNLLLSLLIAVSASNTFASTNKIGNGGDVVDCPSKTRLLDFYEGGLEAVIEKGEPFEVAAKVVDRLKSAAPKLHEHYSRRIQNLKREFEFKEGIELVDLDDSKHLFKPVQKDCSVLQIAIRKAQISGDEKRFLVRKDLWDKLSHFDQVGLILHELVYEHLSQLGEADSVKARKLNRLLFSEYTSDAFWKSVRELKVPIYP